MRDEHDQQQHCAGDEEADMVEQKEKHNARQEDGGNIRQFLAARKTVTDPEDLAGI